MKNKHIRIIVNGAIAVAVFAAWLFMMARGGGLLSSAGLRSLRYFTVLSNLFEGIVSAVLAVTLLRGGDRTEDRTGTSDREKRAGRLGLFNLIAASAVALTFLVVMVFLGPLFGYPAMFRGANLWFHLIVPLAAIAEFILFNETEVPKKACRWVVIFPLAYGTVYLINILVNGAPGNDIYGFTLWGLPVALVIFAVICFATYGMGALMNRANASVRKKCDER